MWRNIFIESCFLSLLVFGGFYINANFLKSKITESGERVKKQSDEHMVPVHISGKGHGVAPNRSQVPHISGSKAPVLPPSKRKKSLGVGSP